ncbi:MAG: beta-lactamase family protein, partial [Deltaproteobacteria bacterium]|nr:beta-lactamase family protein [Deltaproteobacteria bacterium]
MQSETDKTLHAHQERNWLVGGAVAVYRNGKLWQDHCAGTLDPGAGSAPITPDTPFVLFSNSKPLAASCLHWLHGQGAFDWDDAVARYWPEFGQQGKNGVTIRHLLSHQGGFPRTPLALTFERMKDWETSVQIIERMPLEFEPGAAAYHPITLGFALGELVQRLDTRSISSVFRAEIAGPLGLSRTSLGEDPDLSDAGPSIHYLVPEGSPDRQHRMGFIPDPADPSRGTLDSECCAQMNHASFRAACVPAVGAVSSARDLARFYAMYLAGGTLDGIECLKAETVEEALRVQVEGVDTILAETYGEAFAYRGRTLGMCAWEPDSPIIGHAGGGITFAWLDTKKQLTMAYLTNGFIPVQAQYVRSTEMRRAIVA